MKKPAQFSDLDRRRKEAFLKTSMGLDLAIMLIAQKFGHNIARTIKTKALSSVNKMSEEEIDDIIKRLDDEINTGGIRSEINIKSSPSLFNRR